MRVHRLKTAGVGVIAAAMLVVIGTGALANASVITTTPMTTPWQVGLADFQGPLYMAWVENDSSHTLNIAFSTDGVNFSPSIKPFGSGTSFNAPALAVFNNKLWMAWTGTDGNRTLNLASSSNGTTWSAATQPLGKNNSPDGPSLAVFNGRLYYGWKGTDSKGTLNIASSSDGVHFTAPAQPGGNTSTNAPALYGAPGFNGLAPSLVMAWIGTDPNHTLNIAQTTDGVHLYNQRTLGAGSNHQPSVSEAPGGGGLIVDFTAHDDDLAAIPYSDQPVIPAPTELAVGFIIEAPTVTQGGDFGVVHAWVNRSNQISVLSCNDGPPPAGQSNVGPPFC